MQPDAVDLFATKGIEYMLVIGFLIALALFWNLLARRGPGEATVAGGAARGWFELPPALFFHPGHAWALPREQTRVIVGADDFTQRLLGRPDSIRLPAIGQTVEQGAPAWSFTRDGRSVDQLAPIGGRVVARNEAVLDDPGLINRDPYGSGWLLELEAPRIDAGLAGLLRGGLARAWVGLVEQSMRARMAGEMGRLMQDGGLPVSGLARALAPDDWDALARSYLLTARRRR
jgi:glycine cleavage system H lipoate-binding protein